MLLLPRAELNIGPRQRSEIRPESVTSLKNSILSTCLMNPPTVRQDADGRYWLVAGERRTRAIDLIATDELTFRVAGFDEPIPPGSFPCLLADLPLELTQQEAELFENVEREELSWQDRTRTLAAIYALRKAAEPTIQKQKVAAEILSAKGNAAPTKGELDSVSRNITHATFIQKHIAKPSVANARNEKEAFTIALKSEREAIAAETIRRRQKLVAKASVLVEVINADAFAFLPTLPPGRFDLLLTDPPYGIGANKGGFRERAMHHHNYDDSAAAATKAIQLLFLEGFRLTKPRANLWTFIDIRRFNDFAAIGSSLGWDIWPFPIIWPKSNEGLLPGFSAVGPRHVYEALLYATKGKRGLNTHPTDVFTGFPRVKRADRIYAAQKPLALISSLIELSTLVNDEILDPFCGAGTTLRAARLLKRRGIGVELDPDVHKTATTFVFADDVDAAVASMKTEDDENAD